MANPNATQVLPPKMAAEFARLAREGQALMKNGGCYTFIRGNQIITLVGVNPPNGHVCKAKPGEIDRLKAEAKKLEVEAAKLASDVAKTAKTTA